MSATTLKPKKKKKVGAENESVSELKGKLKADLAGASDFRQYLTLRKLMRCTECRATGILVCPSCLGSGEQKMVWNDEITKCEACDGKGEVTCAECMGRKFVLNPHRKKILILAGVGTLGWAWVLFSIYGPSILPEQQSKMLHGGGSGGPAAVPVQKGSINRVPATRGGHAPSHSVDAFVHRGRPSAGLKVHRRLMSDLWLLPLRV